MTSEKSKQLQAENENLKALMIEKENMICQLKEELAYYEDILAHIPGHVYWLNKDNIYLGCNDYNATTFSDNKI